MSTKDSPCTLPINLYAQVQPTITPLDFSRIAGDRQDGEKTTAHYDNSRELLYTSRDVFPTSDAYTPPGGGGVLNRSLCGEVRRGPSYPDPV